MALDLDALLAPLSDDAPCGESVEYDPRFVELETLAKGVAEERDAGGRLIREAEEPDWEAIGATALDLAGISKDLRVGVYLARAELANDGFPGFRDALKLIAGYLGQYWASVHPQLDPDDDNDPSARVFAVVALCHIETVLRAIRLTPLTRSRQFGLVTYRHYAIAHGLMPAPAGGDEVLPDTAGIEAAFSDTDLGRLKDDQAALAEALAAIDAIDGGFDDALGAGYGPDLTPLRTLVREVRAVVDRQVAIREGAELPDEADATGSAVAGSGGGGAGGGSGAIRNRNDVTLTIDRICRYYTENEPSSPVPIILQRVKKLVPMSFLEILQELTPDGVGQFSTVAGIVPEADQGY